MSIGERIVYRIEVFCSVYGISVTKLEEKAGIGRGVIRGWKNHAPRVDLVEKAANALGVKVGILVDK